MIKSKYVEAHIRLWSSSNLRQNMKRVGNIASNRVYNPQNANPPIPLDVDEADSAMEMFIRQKYIDRAVKAPVRDNTGSTNSDDQPTPLPPKTGSRFGFRSASSIFPLSSKHRREAAQSDLEPSRQRPPSPRQNKQSRVFSASGGPEWTEDLELKMAKLQDVGFRDEKRNIAVLKGLGGNLEKSIESLRLVEGAGSTAGVEPSETSWASSLFAGPIAHQHGEMTGNNPYQQNQNPNPFGLMPYQSQYSPNQDFQNMSVSHSQLLFPDNTDGFPGPQPPQYHQLYQQSMTPQSLPHQYYPSVIYENPAQRPVQNNNYNPFMQQQAQQQMPQQMQQPPPINTNFQHKKPFPCGHCEKSFSIKDALTVRSRETHEGKTIFSSELELINGIDAYLSRWLRKGRSDFSKRPQIE